MWVIQWRRTRIVYFHLREGSNWGTPQNYPSPQPRTIPLLRDFSTITPLTKGKYNHLVVLQLIPPFLSGIEALYYIALPITFTVDVHHRDPAGKRCSGINIPNIAFIHRRVDIIICRRRMPDIYLVIKPKSFGIIKAAQGYPAVCHQGHLPQCPVPIKITLEILPCRPMYRREPRMNEQSPVLIFIIRQHPAEEDQMSHFEFHRRPRIAVDRSLPSLNQPVLLTPKPCQPFHTPEIVIPDDECTSIAMVQLDQIIDDLSRLRPTVYIVPQEDQLISRL